MFEGIKETVGSWFKSSPEEGAKPSDPVPSGDAPALDGAKGPAHTATRPWEDSSLSAKERYDSYKAVVREKLGEIIEQADRFAEAKDMDGLIALRHSAEAKHWEGEFRKLLAETPEEFCRRQDGGHMKKELGKNFLGPDEWKSQGIDVGVVPPIPSSITKELLDSDCPLHPGEKIKDTHLLVLIPKTVNGEAYTALKLDELCATRKGSGGMLIADRFDSWKAHRWASTPQTQSEWVLIPKSDPVRGEVSADKHFRGKTIAQQAEVHREHYGDYREAKTLEVMTAALLNDMVNGEPRMLDGFNYLRCEESNASGGSVCVGVFYANGLKVRVDDDVSGQIYIGRALARKSRA